MRTNLVLDDMLVKEAMRCSGAKTKREVVDLALRELVQTRKRGSLADLKGRITLARGYDYKRTRQS